MGTPCRCCGKVICKSEEIRFDHDRYNYNGSIAFVHITQTISRSIDGGEYQQVSKEEHFFQDEETIACNFTVESIFDTFEDFRPVSQKTVTTVVRKFVLRYSIDDVYDWDESNREDHDFINSIFIRAGNCPERGTDAIIDVPVGRIDVYPGYTVDLQGVIGKSKFTSPSFPDTEGRLYIAAGRNIDPPQSMEDWNNLANGKPSYGFNCENLDEIFIEKEDINENNDYYVLVECLEHFDATHVRFPKVPLIRWGTWTVADSRGSQFQRTKVSNRAFIELRRITDIGMSSVEPLFDFFGNLIDQTFSPETCFDQPALQDHSIKNEDDFDDWHTLFTRTADGTYVSKNTYMDKEFNFGDFFKSDWSLGGSKYVTGYPDKFFVFCGELQFGFLNPDGGEYLDLLYKIDYSRQPEYVIADPNIGFTTECFGKGTDREKSWPTKDTVTAQFDDPLNPGQHVYVTKSRSEAVQAPTDIFPSFLKNNSTVGDYFDVVYRYNVPYDNNILKFRYNVVGGEDRFNGADYLISEFIANYSDCEDIEFLHNKDPFADNRCPSPTDYLSNIDNKPGYLTKPLRSSRGRRGGFGSGLINSIFIRPCVIESSSAMIVSDGPDRRMYDTDIVKSYRYVPHYGEYEPAVIRFTIRNHEFYPYKLKLNDINDACPKECIPTEHIPEWQLLESSFSCAGSPSLLNTINYGTAGGLGLNDNTDVFACCTKLKSDRQLIACKGKYAVNTSFSMRVANYIASSPSAWDLGGHVSCRYPKCNVLHREKDKLAVKIDFCGNSPLDGCITAEGSIDHGGSDKVLIGIDDVCNDGNIGSTRLGSLSFFPFGATGGSAKYSNLLPNFTMPEFSTDVRFVDQDLDPRTFNFIGSPGYYSLGGVFDESQYRVARNPSAPFEPFSQQRIAGKNLTIFATRAFDAKEYSTGQFAYAKTCLEKSLDVEGYEIENEFDQEHDICITEVSFSTTFSLDKEVQKGNPNNFSAKQHSDVVLQDPDCGKGLRWRVNTGDIGIFEALFDYDSDTHLTHAIYFYERGELDLVYQDFVPVIEFEDGVEGAARMRSIAECVGKYLATLEADEQFDYWYELANDVTLALQPGDNGYYKTEIRSDEAGIQVLEIHKEVGDLVELGEKVFTMKTSDINIRSNLGSGIVTSIFKPEGSIVRAGDIVIEITLNDELKQILAPEDGQISAINVAIGDNVSINQILAVMITKKTITSPVKGAIDSIEVEVGDVVFNTQLMASVVSTVTFPKGSYVKVMPDGNFDGPFENHSIYQNKIHYEVKDNVIITVDGVWAKGKPAEGKKHIHLGSCDFLEDARSFNTSGFLTNHNPARIPSEITHQGDGYKFTFYTADEPGAYASDFGVDDNQAPELGDAPSEYFSDFFIPSQDETIFTYREISPSTENTPLQRAGECPTFVGMRLSGDGDPELSHEFGDDVLSVQRVRIGLGINDIFADRHRAIGNRSAPCGYMIEERLDGGKYKTGPGELTQGTGSVSVDDKESDDPRGNGRPDFRQILVSCYTADPSFYEFPEDKRTSCRNMSGTLNFCDPCQGDFSCTYTTLGCPDNYKGDRVVIYEDNGFGGQDLVWLRFGIGLWGIINSGNSTDIQLPHESRQDTQGGWDHKYDLGESVDASYGETETYRCLKLPFGAELGGIELQNSCLVPEGLEYTKCAATTDNNGDGIINSSDGLDTTERCPDDQRNYVAETLRTTYRKIVLKSEFNKCGDDRLPDLNYTHKDLVGVFGFISGFKHVSFPQAVVTNSVDLSPHELSIDDYDFTAEKKQKINEKLSELNKKFIRGDADAPVNVYSTASDKLFLNVGVSNQNLCGEGINFKFKRSLDNKLNPPADPFDAHKVDCKLENFIPNIHADKFGTVINQIEKLNAFYEAVDNDDIASHLLHVYVYGSLNKKCVEEMNPAMRTEANITFLEGLEFSGDELVAGGDTQPQYGRRFIDPASCYTIDFKEFCALQPENPCTQIDENAPLPSPGATEKPPCQDIFGSDRADEGDGINSNFRWYLDVMGWKPGGSKQLESTDGEAIPNIFRNESTPIKPIDPAELAFRDSGIERFNIPPLQSAPYMKVEVNKTMCSLKKYSFTIGD